MYTWGCNDEGALGRVTHGDIAEESIAGKADLEEEVNIIQVSAGDSHTVALSDRGCVYAWGTYRVGICTWCKTVSTAPLFSYWHHHFFNCRFCVL